MWVASLIPGNQHIVHNWHESHGVLRDDEDVLRTIKESTWHLLGTTYQFAANYQSLYWLRHEIMVQKLKAVQITTCSWENRWKAISRWSSSRCSKRGYRSQTAPHGHLVRPTSLTQVCLFVCFWRDPPPAPPVGQGLIHEVPRSHTTTHHSRQDSSGRVISPSQRPLPDNTQQSQQTNIHAPGGIRTHNLSRRAAADPRLRRRGHWYRPLTGTCLKFPSVWQTLPEGYQLQRLQPFLTYSAHRVEGS